MEASIFMGVFYFGGDKPILSTDVKQRAEFYSEMLHKGIFSINEIKEIEKSYHLKKMNKGKV